MRWDLISAADCVVGAVTCTMFLFVFWCQARKKHKAKSVVEEYDEAASTYDTKWYKYTSATVEATLQLAMPFLESKNSHSCDALDIGCGTGAFTLALQDVFPMWNFSCADPSPAMLKQASKRFISNNIQVKVVRCSGEDLPFEDNSFDVVSTLSSFHFWMDHERGTMELHRILKPGGILIVTDWCHNYLACKLCAAYLRLAGYPRQDWQIMSVTDLQRVFNIGKFDTQLAKAYPLKGLRLFPGGPRWGMMTFVIQKQL